jgi:hypothetical protein
MYSLCPDLSDAAVILQKAPRSFPDNPRTPRLPRSKTSTATKSLARRRLLRRSLADAAPSPSTTPTPHPQLTCSSLSTLTQASHPQPEAPPSANPKHTLKDPFLGSAMAGNHSRGDAPATTEEPHAVLCYR